MQAEKTYDYVIKQATLFDGERLQTRQTDVGIRGDLIVKIGHIGKAKVRIEIQAKGWILAPGFIDTHTHSDFNPLIYPGLANKVLQGVTTEVTGNCGMSAAPVLGSHKERLPGIWAREGVEIGTKLRWRSFREYRQALESAGMITNYVSLVGHGNLRSAVMGFSERPASLGEIDEMRTMLRDAMKDGASGISYGLVYLPGIFASEEELVDLCREAGRNLGICAFHIRSEGGQLVESIQETLRIAEKAKTPIEISHLKAAGKANWEKIGEVLELIEAARRKGLKVSADVYPYTGSFAELGVILPDALYQREDRLAYFRNPMTRDDLLNELREYYQSRNMKWDAVMIAATRHKKYWPYEGKTLFQIAREMEKEPEQVLIEILADTAFEISAFYFSQSDEVIGSILKKEYVSVGSDSIADDSRKPHPRAFGAFPKVLGEYTRDRKLLSIAEALYKMTALPAAQFSLKNRGKIKKGYFADLVLFDGAGIDDTANYENPKSSPKGIGWVFVNGKPAVQDGKYTGIKNGRFLAGS